MAAVGRNRYSIVLDFELDEPLSCEHAKPAAALLAADLSKWLREKDWGYGMARVTSCFAPSAQWEHGDFVPDSEVAAMREP